MKFGRAAAAALVLAVAAPVIAPPAVAQSYSEGYTFLKAVKERDAEKVTALVSRPGTTVVNTRDRGTGETALHTMVRGRDYTWLSFLIGKGARVDIQNNAGDTPLNLAAQIGWTEGAELILARGGSVDLANRRGETPLILAVQRGDLAMTRLLLRGGANPKKADNVAGYTALDYAKQAGRSPALLKLLEGQAAKPARGVAGPKL
ncbi:MAG TPA: ankyrin repeat domain-containing protein [Allosphingosinicella sp.]